MGNSPVITATPATPAKSALSVTEQIKQNMAKELAKAKELAALKAQLAALESNDAEKQSLADARAAFIANDLPGLLGVDSVQIAANLVRLVSLGKPLFTAGAENDGQRKARTMLTLAQKVDVLLENDKRSKGEENALSQSAIAGKFGVSLGTVINIANSQAEIVKLAKEAKVAVPSRLEKVKTPAGK